MTQNAATRRPGDGGSRRRRTRTQTPRRIERFAKGQEVCLRPGRAAVVCGVLTFSAVGRVYDLPALGTRYFVVVVEQKVLLEIDGLSAAGAFHFHEVGIVFVIVVLE